jgi:hypothetical protein
MKKEPKSWREQVRFRSTFTPSNDRLTVSGILRFDEDSPNPRPSCVLEFFGDCENEDGEMVKRKKRYDITPAIAATIVEAIHVLGRFENDRPPEILRERFIETAAGFVLLLKQTPEKVFFALQNIADRWKFETEKRNELFEAFCDAAR